MLTMQLRQTTKNRTGKAMNLLIGVQLPRVVFS